MADCKRKVVKSHSSPLKSITKEHNPDSFYQEKPSWCFNRCDKEKWCLNKETADEAFWSEVLPLLQLFETLTWQDILVQAQHKNHNIELSKLNTCARKRLSDLHIEAESITSLRLNGTHRLYGYIIKGVYYILWYDINHGDNSSCVCRSKKKHT